jgi:DNA-binding NarL/FixJ family response regulator
MRILLVDDHTLVRESLRRVLENQEGIEVVGEASNGLEAIEMASALAPELILMDSAMPMLGGIEATRKLCAQESAARILAVSQYNDEETVFGMMNAGALGFVSKNDDFRILMDAIQTVHRGEYFLGSRVTGTFLSNYLGSVAKHAAADPPQRLTDREVQVLTLIAEGHGSKVIGNMLNISSRTVDAHRRNIVSKLGISSTAGLTKWAVMNKLTSPEP